mmetsp:Transcript_15257/g.52995  ORF Transcript_15257/g.52995 Transcript_15257/m.52995 type:complete len:458 (+) Transcript_15257:345-1718(+)
MERAVRLRATVYARLGRGAVMSILPMGGRPAVDDVRASSATSDHTNHFVEPLMSASSAADSSGFSHTLTNELSLTPTTDASSSEVLRGARPLLPPQVGESSSLTARTRFCCISWCISCIFVLRSPFPFFFTARTPSANRIAFARRLYASLTSGARSSKRDSMQASISLVASSSPSRLPSQMRNSAPMRRMAAGMAGRSTELMRSSGLTSSRSTSRLMRPAMALSIMMTAWVCRKPITAAWRVSALTSNTTDDVPIGNAKVAISLRRSSAMRSGWSMKTSPATTRRRMSSRVRMYVPRTVSASGEFAADSTSSSSRRSMAKTSTGLGSSSGMKMMTRMTPRTTLSWMSSVMRRCTRLRGMFFSLSCSRLYASSAAACFTCKRGSMRTLLGSRPMPQQLWRFADATIARGDSSEPEEAPAIGESLPSIAPGLSRSFAFMGEMVVRERSASRRSCSFCAT